MAVVDILQLVKVQIKPVLTVDSTLEADLPIYINAALAQQGWTEATMDDAQRNYAAALTLEGLIPRLVLIYTDEVQEQVTGPERTKLPNRAEFFRVLQKAIDNLKESAAEGAGVATPEDAALMTGLAWPGCGLKAWADKT